MISSTTLRVGLAVGGGTGPELAAVFEKVMVQLAARHSVEVEFVRSSRCYHSYATLLIPGKEDNTAEVDICDETIEDVRHYQNFCEQEAANGLRVIFRTAISAQALYIVRERLLGVKVEHYDLGTASLLMIRDQAQGFYSGWSQLDESRENVLRTCRFGKDVFRRLISFGIERARQRWSDRGKTIDTVFMVYKFHLFDGLFRAWSDEWSQEYGIKVEFIQPDTMNRNLLAFGVQGNCLMIAGNEYADIMQIVLLSMFGLESQETSFAENVYLHPDLHGLSEFQTVHGSADDIVGKGIVNPLATIRATAAILEQYSPCPGTQQDVERALQILQQQRMVTPDKGGSQTTAAVVNALLELLSTDLMPPPKKAIAPEEDHSANRSLAFLGKSSAVAVVDFQNDFVTNGSVTAMAGIAAHIQRVVSFARNHDVEVIWVRFLGDMTYQAPTWRDRDSIQQRQAWCIQGSWGAEIYPAVTPAAGERVFDKKAVFDPFLSAEFDKYLANKGYQHLVLLGLYADICVDAAAKTAFQKGLWTTIVRDCTTTLHLGEKDMLGYMDRVYGSRVVTSDELLAMEV